MSKDMRGWLAGRKAGSLRMALLRSAAPLTLLLAADPAWAACNIADIPSCSAPGGAGIFQRTGGGGAGNGAGGGASVFNSGTGNTDQVVGSPTFVDGTGGTGAAGEAAGGAGGGVGTALTGSASLAANSTGDIGSIGANGLSFSSGGGGGGAGTIFIGSQLTINGGVTTTGGLGGAGGSGGGSPVSNGAGGGGGGAGLMTNTTAATIQINGAAIGGAGGRGGDGGFNGGGGAGGDGLLAFGTGTSITNAGTLRGGLGAAAGTGTSGSSARAGASGSGANLAGTGLTLTNNGTITGGGAVVGGRAGMGVVTWGGNVIENRGAISGGLNSDGSTATAVQFHGTGNRLSMYTGSSINGGIALAENAGAVIWGDSINFGQVSDISLGANSELTFDSPNVLHLAGVITGSGNMIKNGPGALRLSGNSNATGNFTLNAGTLTLDTANSLSSGLLLVGGPATLNTLFAGSLSNTVQLNAGLTVNSVNTLTLSGDISGAGSLTLGSGNLVLTGANNHTGGTVLQVGSVHVGNNSALGTGTLTVNGPAGLTAASGVALGNTVVLNNTLNFGAGGGPLTLAGVISGAGGLSLAGAPGLTLNGANTFSGGFNLGGGALVVGHNTALGSGAVTVSGAGSLEANAGVSLTNNFNLNAGLAIDGSNNLALNGAIGGLGGLTKSGAVNLTLGGANGFAGGINLRGGGLTVGTNTSLGLGALTVNGAGTFRSTAGVNLGNAIVLNAGLGIGGSSDIALGGVISGGAGLSFNGTGTLALNAANTFSGGFRLESGTLSVGNASALGSGTLSTTGSATLRAGLPGMSLGNLVNLGNGTTLGVTGANSLALLGTIFGDGGMLINAGGNVTLGGANNFNGGVELQSGTLLVATNSSLGNGALSVTGNAGLASTGADLNLGNAVDLGAGNTLTTGGSADLVLGGTIGGGGSLIKAGTGRLVLTGDNSFAGATTINAGTVQLGNGGGTGSVAGDIVNNSALVVDRAGVVTLAGVISGTGTVTKTGAGTLILSGSNAAGGQYTGTTTVNQGILRVEGAFGDTVGNAAQVNVASGGTLQGNGTVHGDVAVQSNGTLSAGASPGMLTIAGDLTLGDGSTSLFEFGTPNVAGGPTNDLVTVGGNLAMDGTLNVSAASAGYYRLFDVGGTISGAFDALVTPGFTNADVFVIPNQVNLSVRNASQLLQHWDGPDASGATPGAGGGDGVWNGTGTNWTADPITGAINDAWRGSVAVFGGAAGTVVVAPGSPSFDTIQFNTDGYHLLSGNLAIGVAGVNAGNAALTGSIINVTTGTTTIDSVIQDGAGNHLNVVGSGTLVLTGANSYSGGTSLLGGRVSVDTDANLGAASGGLTFDGGILQVRGTAFTGTGRTITWGAAGGGFDISSAFNTFTVSQSLGGTGGLSKLGAGTLVLSGANSYSGGTTISQGTLSVGATGALGSGAVAVGTGSTLMFQNGTRAGNLKLTTAPSTGPGVNGGFIQFADGSSADHAQILNGSLGAVSFRGTATADAAQFDNSGTVSFRESASAGSAVILNRNGASTNFTDGASASQATIFNMAGGVADFFDSSTAANAVVSNDGTVLFRDTTSAGSARIVNGNGGHILFRAGADASGSSITNTAGGTLDISRATDGTAIGALSGAGTVLLGSKTLILGGLGGSETIDGILQDGGAGGGTGGSLVKTGAGTLMLTGTSSYTGATTVNAGTLTVDGSIANSALAIKSGARLSGTGTVGGTTIKTGGVIAPGNSIGTLTVHGNYTQATGSTYEAEIAPDGTSDRIEVTGAATIQGGTVFAAKAPGTYALGTRYTILTAAGGVTGTYAALDQNAPFIDLALGYDPKAIYLDVIRNAVAFPTVGNTPNQKAAAAGAESLSEGNALYNAIAGLPDVPSARAAFDGLSGEINASAVTGMLEDSRFVREAMNDRLRAAFETVGAVPLMGYGEDAKDIAMAPSERYGAWGSMFGSWGHFGSDGNAVRLSRSVGGFVTGIDGLVTDDVRLGFLAGYSHSSLKVDDRRSSASTDNYHLGIYGGTQWGALSFRSGLAYSWSEIDTSRQVAFPGFADSLSSDYRAGTTQVFGELGYGIKAGNVGFEPFANLAYVNVHTNGFTEQGGISALTVYGGSNDITFTTLGLRASTDFDIGSARATVRGTIGWRHAYGDVTPEISQAFTGSNAFSIAGAPIARDAAVIEAGLDFAIAPTATLGVSYHGQVGSRTSDHGVRADLNVKF